MKATNVNKPAKKYISEGEIRTYAFIKRNCLGGNKKEDPLKHPVSKGPQLSIVGF
jgi:hypothetical protein